MLLNTERPHIDDFPIPRIFATSPRNSRRQRRYCDETHGAILNALLDRADESNDIDVVLGRDFNRFQDLIRRCNLGPRGYKRMTMPAIRRCIDWVRAKALQYGAVISTPNGLIRVPGHSFSTDADAAEWLEANIRGRVRPHVSTRPRWQRQATSPAQSLPPLEALSLSDDEPAVSTAQLASLL